VIGSSSRWPRAHDLVKTMTTNVKSDNKMLRDFFLGFVKVHVLHHASRGPVYGVWFIEELARHNYHLSPGTLYPLLHNLEAAGYLQREDRVVEGKVRKYYEITPLGSKALTDARSKIQELVDEIMEPEPPAKSPARRTRASR
jgi:PadR family transcriptional regulator, regulatory protein PadR